MNQKEIRNMADRKRPILEVIGDIDVLIVLARTRQAMRKAQWTTAEIAEATEDMMSDDRYHLADVVYELCDVE